MDEALLQLAKIVIHSHIPRELRIKLLRRVAALECDAGIRYAELPFHCADSLVAMLDSGQKENDNLFKVGALTKERRDKQVGQTHRVCNGRQRALIVPAIPSLSQSAESIAGSLSFLTERK
jgi:hypothetical protein